MDRLIPIALLVVAPVWASAASIGVEIEHNDVFATRNVLAADVRTVEAALETSFDPAEAEIATNETLDDMEVDAFAFTEDDGGGALTPGRRYAAVVDNTGDEIDTILESVDETGARQAFNDDGSPLGDGFGSAVGGVVTTDPAVRLRLSGYGDDAFTGDHDEMGDYALYVFFDRTPKDVDVFTFTGLTPGNLFTAEIGSTEPFLDTMLGLFDETGALIDVDDDGGVGFLSLMTGEVGASGALTFAVSGFGDDDFSGLHDESGAYSLGLATRAAPVPLPPAIGLIGAAFAGLVAFRRRR